MRFVGWCKICTIYAAAINGIAIPQHCFHNGNQVQLLSSTKCLSALKFLFLSLSLYHCEDGVYSLDVIMQETHLSHHQLKLYTVHRFC